MTRPSPALGVLAALDAIDAGAPAQRRISKPPRVRKPKQALCRNGCGHQIVIAATKAGGWCALDAHPSGDMTIVNSTVRDYAELMGDVSRYVWHKCEVKP